MTVLIALTLGCLLGYLLSYLVGGARRHYWRVHYRHKFLRRVGRFKAIHGNHPSHARLPEIPVTFNRKGTQL